MNGIKRLLTAGVLVGLVSTTPAIASTVVETNTGNTTLHALTSFDQSLPFTLEPMSDNELESIQGEFINIGINFAFAPQFNFCVFCSGVNQSNVALILGFNVLH